MSNNNSGNTTSRYNNTNILTTVSTKNIQKNPLLNKVNIQDNGKKLPTIKIQDKTGKYYINDNNERLDRVNNYDRLQKDNHNRDRELGSDIEADKMPNDSAVDIHNDNTVKNKGKTNTVNNINIKSIFK